MDYNAAENYCRNIGYDMAKIHGEKKNNYVVKILNSLTLDNAWIKPYIGRYMPICSMKFLVYDCHPGVCKRVLMPEFWLNFC